LIVTTLLAIVSGNLVSRILWKLLNDHRSDAESRDL
jgi:hypothetical protein